jgi:peptide/nickel transport system permease protein
LLAAGITVTVGFLVGLVSGYYGGLVEEILMRATDLAYSLPLAPFILVLAGIVRPSIWNIIFAIALLQWRSPARVIRAEVLSISQRAYIKAAKVAGASNRRIMFLHIAPNVISLFFLYMAIVTGWAILTEASVSFLGFGDPTMITWGKILQMAFQTGSVRTAWWWVLPPGVAIMLTVLSVFLISLSFEEISNPRLKGY